MTLAAAGGIMQTLIAHRCVTPLQTSPAAARGDIDGALSLTAQHGFANDDLATLLLLVNE
jgi:hypothetical protein